MTNRKTPEAIVNQRHKLRDIGVTFGARAVEFTAGGIIPGPIQVFEVKGKLSQAEAYRIFNTSKGTAIVEVPVGLRGKQRSRMLLTSVESAWKRNGSPDPRRVSVTFVPAG